MKPDIEKQLKRAAEPPIKYPPARVAWYGPEYRKPFNPVYESMIYPFSSEALQADFIRLAVPNTAMIGSICGIILLLRLRRREHTRRTDTKNVVTIPPRAREAA
jgi:hypothetical protein